MLTTKVWLPLMLLVPVLSGAEIRGLPGTGPPV